MPVTLKIETEGNPEEQKVEVMGTSSEFSVEHVRQAEEKIVNRPQQPGAALRPGRARGGGHSLAASIHDVS